MKNMHKKTSRNIKKLCKQNLQLKKKKHWVKYVEKYIKNE